MMSIAIVHGSLMYVSPHTHILPEAVRKHINNEHFMIRVITRQRDIYRFSEKIIKTID